MEIEIILYVENQSRSKKFYKELLQMDPFLDVDGMTEFQLTENFKLGLMPLNGIAKLLGDRIVKPGLSSVVPRSEVYLKVDDIDKEFDRAIRAGAEVISPVQARDWGDRAGYFTDPDGHIIAFASPIKQH